MTLRTRLYLQCEGCGNPYPACGVCPSPVDGAIFSPTELRADAKANGWTRKRNDVIGAVIDLCPRCTKKAAKKAGK